MLHDVEFNGKSVMRRGSLVEMAVPYADPHPPFQRKCAFDVGDYGQRHDPPRPIATHYVQLTTAQYDPPRPTTTHHGSLRLATTR